MSEIEFVYEFGPFRLETALHLLLREGLEIEIERLPFAVLSYLVKNRHTVVTKNKLIDDVWGFDKGGLTDDAVYKCISNIRSVLDDSEEPYKYIKNVFGVGYRFIAEVREIDLGGMLDTSEHARESELMSLDGESADNTDLNTGIPTPDTGESHSIYIQIGDATAVEVDAQTGAIVGPNAEGTLGIVLYGGSPQFIAGQRFESEKAIRIPRLLQSDILLNFHVGEIVYHESRQAARFIGTNSLLGAIDFYRFGRPNTFTKIPGSNHPCYVGFYLSATSRYELCLVSRDRAWPIEFDAYLKTKGGAAKLFEELETRAESKEVDVFSKLLFLPDRRGASLEVIKKDSLLLEDVSRDTLPADYAKREVKGWWFNIPVAVYPWMTANLERLLANCIDELGDADRTSSSGLRDWNLRNWFQLIVQLASGLIALHEKGAIHGDPRPANIMTDVLASGSVGPHSFRWIDIGLGYVTQEDTPRPLGGGRSTIFYSPERDEAKEFEDADSISLEPDETEPHLSQLTFRWRKQTHFESAILPLKKNGIALRELGKLTKGDRIQVREFLFDVERVEENFIIVSKIYEVFLDRLLVEKKGKKRELVHKTLQTASISRYRIFQQWSQATDIYGLGMISLYLFFVRGLFRMKSRFDSLLAESSSTASSSIYDRGNREAIFSELAILLRNRSFLENLLNHLRNMHLESFDELRNEVHKPNSEKAKEISEWIRSTDTNFEVIWHGLNQDHGLFSRLIYFCLCCLWRENEVREIIERQYFDFTPFCPSRLKLEGPEQALPAQLAHAMIEEFIPIAYAIPDVDDSSESHAPKDLLVDREKQMIVLREGLKSAQAQIKFLQNVSVHKDRKTRKVLHTIRDEAEGIKEEIDTKLMVRKDPIKNHIKRMIDVVDEGENLLRTSEPPLS